MNQTRQIQEQHYTSVRQEVSAAGGAHSALVGTVLGRVVRVGGLQKANCYTGNHHGSGKPAVGTRNMVPLTDRAPVTYTTQPP